MHYIKITSSKNIVYLAHFDPEMDQKYVDILLDKGHRIEPVAQSNNSNHISLMFSESIRESVQRLLRIQQEGRD